MPGQQQPPTRPVDHEHDDQRTEHPPTSYLHMICDAISCTHVITLGLSETMEDAWRLPAGQLVLDAPDSPVTQAIHAAAVVLGWRRELLPGGGRMTRCPRHTAGLVCARCLNRDCSCVGGPGFDVVRRKP